MTWWVWAPDENCLAGLSDFVQERNWDGCPALHIGDCGIVPVSDYSVSSVDSAGDSPTSLAIGTIRKPGVKWWGDCIGRFDGIVAAWTPPSGNVGIDDTVAIIKTFQQDPVTATHVSVTDVHPQVPNRVVNIDDALFSIFGFQGFLYPFGCPDDPCWNILAAPCP